MLRFSTTTAACCRPRNVGRYATWLCAAPPCSAATSSTAWTVDTSASLTTRAATATVPSARPWPAPNGLIGKRSISCRSSTTMWCSPCRRRLATWRRPIPPSSTTCFCAAPPPRCVRWRPILKRLGAVLGVLMVLHTWGQNLHHHPHVHCVVTGGGLSCDSAGKIDAVPRWLACRPGFFLPVRVLSRVFRGKFLAGLREAFSQDKLILPGRLATLAEPDGRVAWWSSLYDKEWVVYAKRPFGGPEQVLKYLARYTHRVAISNARLVDLSNGRVTFRYKDYADGQQHKTMTLDADEFLRRFVQHVLPKGFVKIRHYGLLANAQRAARLALCRRLLLVATVAAALSSTDAASIETAQPRCCPNCGGTRLLYRELTRTARCKRVERPTVRKGGRR